VAGIQKGTTFDAPHMCGYRWWARSILLPVQVKGHNPEKEHVGEGVIPSLKRRREQEMDVHESVQVTQSREGHDWLAGVSCGMNRTS